MNKEESQIKKIEIYKQFKTTTFLKNFEIENINIFDNEPFYKIRINLKFTDSCFSTLEFVRVKEIIQKLFNKRIIYDFYIIFKDNIVLTFEVEKC
jgi:hypothetical protein